MWGNRLGWGISAAIVLVFGFFAYLIILGGRTTAPTAFSLKDATVNAPLALPVAPGSIVAMDKPGVAGPLYRKAINDYLSNPQAYERLLRDRNPDLATLLPGHQALIDATHLNQMDLFARSPEQVISYSSDLPELNALGQVAQTLNMLALRNQSAGNNDRATRYFQATFALGAKLFDEGLSYPQVSMGLGQMATAAIQLEKLDPSRADQIKAFREAYAEYSGRLQEAQRKINSMDPKISYRHAGDVYHIAQTPQFETLWRVESLLKLGRFRYDASPRHPGDQRQALPTLRKYINDPDPAIKTAATLAHDLTEVQYRKLGA